MATGDAPARARPAPRTDPVGRRYRLVSARLRRLVLERDGYHCAYPGCRARHYLQVHHIVHWEEGGENSLANLISLRTHHHTFVHEHGWPPGFNPRTAANAA